MFKKLLVFLITLFIVIGNMGVVSYAESKDKPSIPEKVDILIQDNKEYCYISVSNAVEGAIYTFSSSNTKVLKVEYGKGSAELIAVKKGDAIVTCTQTLDGKAEVIGKCKVTVKIAAPEIPKEIDIHIGSVPYHYMSISNKVEGATYAFSSSNPKIVKCSKNIGALTGIKEGTAIITCKQTLNGKVKVIGTCKVTVRKAELTYTDRYIYYGESGFCEIEYGNLLAEYKYTSSNPEILSVDKRGIYTGKRAGNAVVTIYETYKGTTRKVGKISYEVIGGGSETKEKEEIVEYGYYGNEIEVFLDYNYNRNMNEYNYWFPVPRPTIGLFWLPSVVSFYSNIYQPEIHFSVKDTSICSIEDEVYLRPHKEGVTYLYCTINNNGKSYELGRHRVVVKKMDMEEYYINTISLLMNGGDKTEIKITEGHSVDISKDLYTNLNGSLLEYQSKDTSIVTVDLKTGFLTAQKPGITSIIIGNEEVNFEIAVTVLKKGSMGKLEEDAKEYIERLDELMNVQVTKENFEEVFCEFADILAFYKSCKIKYEDDYQMEYFILPNITYCDELADTLESYYKKASETMVDPFRKIIDVKLINNKKIKIKFDKPLTKIDVIDLSYGLYFSDGDNTKNSRWYNFTILDKTGRYLGQSFSIDMAESKAKEGMDEITLIFNEDIRKGSYYIIWDYYGFQPFGFEI